jgi:hypothetical protein
MNSESKKPLTIDYAFIIAILTGVLYLESFLYIAGLFSYYRLPWFLIDIDVSSIINSIVHLSPFVIMIAWGTVIIFRKPKSPKKQNQKENIQAEISSRKHKKKSKTKAILAIILFLVIISLCISIAIYLLNMGLLFGLIFGTIIDFVIILSSILYKKRNFVYLAIVIYITSSVLAFGYGYLTAIEEDTYIIVEDGNNTMISIAVYKEQFVLSPFNMNTKEFSDEYKLIEMKDVNNFQQVDVGKIKMKK